MTKVAGFVAKQLEPRLRRKRFNQLGALQLDADVRALVAFFVERASRRVRARFVRLLHVSQVLNLESPGEIMEYWGAGAPGALAWELTAEEVRAVMALRTDWAPADIAKLRL